jgi:hypothetical protein
VPNRLSNSAPTYQWSSDEVQPHFFPANGHPKGSSNGQHAPLNGTRRREVRYHQMHQASGIRYRLSRPTIFISNGTQALMLLVLLYNRVLTDVGVIPRSMGFLGIEASREAIQPGLFSVIPIGVDGAGTVAEEGRQAVVRKADEIHAAIQQIGSRLDHTDPHAPASCPRNTSIAVVIVGGPGGTASGGKHEVATLAHSALRHATESVEMHDVTLAPGMSIHDIHKTVTNSQMLHMAENTTNNLCRQLGDFHSAATLTEQPAGQPAFSQKASERFSSLMLLDRSNGAHCFSTMDDFLVMAARNVRLRFLTQAGSHVASRLIDLDKLGDRQRGHAASPINVESSQSSSRRTS